MTRHALLDALVAEPDRAGLFLDFDGTLTAIVDDPATSTLPRSTAATLDVLATRLAVVAVVSGRPAAFLADRARIDGVRLLGVYGLEEWADGRAVPRPEAERWHPVVREVVDRLPARLEWLPEGVRIEDKGLSVALHWRNAADHDAAQAAVERVAAALASETGLAREPGKLVEELRPPVDWDKGATVDAIADERGLDRLAYIGDDRGDLTAFAAVRHRGGVCVAVDHGAETPRELLAEADIVVAGPDGVIGLLEELRAALP